MRFLLFVARVLRLPSPVLRPWANDVSVRRARRAERRDPGPQDTSTALTPGARRSPFVVTLLVLAGVAAIAFLVLQLPTTARSATIAALQISLLRVTDVMLGVFRTTFIVRGRTLAASMAAGGEAAAWLTAAGIVLSDLTLIRGAAFAVGVAMGTALGVIVVRSLRLGMVTVRVFAPLERGREVADLLRTAGQGATVFPGEGRDGPVAMVLSVMRRREADEVCRPLTLDAQLYVAMDAGMGPSGAGRASAK